MDGAIHRAAGPELLQECRTLRHCPTGEARLTRGYRLPARYVIHAVGPVWRGGRAGEAGLLSSAYRSALVLAEQNGVRSIAFPAISCGVYAYPIEKAAGLAVSTVRSHVAGSSIETVFFACFGEDVERAYRSALEAS